MKFQIRLEIFDLIFFLWLLISYQTSKLRPKINVWKKNQISDRKIKSCWNDLIWNLLLDLTWFIFAVFDVKSFWLLIFMWQGKRAYVYWWKRNHSFRIIQLWKFCHTFSKIPQKLTVFQMLMTAIWLWVKNSSSNMYRGPLFLVMILHQKQQK